MTAPKCDSVWMNAFLEELSNAYPDDYIVLIMDNSRWHKSGILNLPENIQFEFIPPYTPEMNPIERLWKEMRKAFANKLFASLKLVEDHLKKFVSELTNEQVVSVTNCEWILDIF